MMFFYVVLISKICLLPVFVNSNIDKRGTLLIRPDVTFVSVGFSV